MSAPSPTPSQNASAPSVSEGIGHVETTSNVQQQSNTQQQVLSRPWWRPPARNFRANPVSINPHIAPTFPEIAPSGNSTSLYSESLPHFWFRSMTYILRIPFRELVGNISRPYDPTAPAPLPDVPLTTVLVDTQTNQTYYNSYIDYPAQRTTNHSEGGGAMPENTTTGSPDYLAQIRKGWKDRTPDMSWALSTAYFTSVILTIVAIAALIIDWKEECTYLKIFLVVFVVRKWIVTFIMIDRALYRLPLGLTEPDADIDEERHNGIAIYMSHLFSWHGYAMLFFGSFYVFFYGSINYISSATVVTGASIAFACMGLVPFFALLALMFTALVALYIFYIFFVCLAWPFEKCGLSRRRAISRRNGGYQSNGTTNTTDLREIERAIEDAENEESGGGGFARTDSIKITPAMNAIPVVIFRKPGATVVEIKSEDTVCGGVISTSQSIGNTTPDLENQKAEPSEEIEMTTESLSIKDKMKDSPKPIDSEPMEVIIPINDMPENSWTDQTTSQQKPETSGKSVSIRFDDEEISSTNDNESTKDKDSSSIASNKCRKAVSTELKEVWSISDLSTYPTIADEECAICLFDFEDGDELRHLYCDHFFHRNCVDRWLSKNPHCPKCKRVI